jgi:hypothetical protein
MADIIVTPDGINEVDNGDENSMPSTIVRLPRVARHIAVHKPVAPAASIDNDLPAPPYNPRISEHDVE